MKQILHFSVIVLLLFSCQKDISSAPVARFEFSELTADQNGANFSFNNLSANATIYNWTFGDGVSSSQSSPTYTFKKNGTYTVALEAKGDGGSNTFSQAVKVTSVPTTGQFLFWSQIGDKGNTNIKVAGVEVGKITVFGSAAGTPECGTSGFVTVKLPEGTYSFTAQSQGLIPLNWSGTFQVINGMCRSTELTR